MHVFFMLILSESGESSRCMICHTFVSVRGTVSEYNLAEAFSFDG